MSAEWKETTLGQIVAEGGGFIQTGPFGSQLHASDYVDEGIPCIMPVNISDNQLSEDGIMRISPIDAQRLSRHLVRMGDIIYSRRGDVTRRSLIRDAADGWFCGTGCLLIRPGTAINPEFLAYHLGLPNTREWIIRHAIGATMPNLNTTILGDIPLVVPSGEVQDKIASILSSIDNKIELTRQMNATLEEMAQALFKQWFVDFEFPFDFSTNRPDSNGLPYKSSGGKMVDSERGPIPEGWEISTVSDCLELAYGKALKKTDRKAGEVPVYGSGGIAGTHSSALVEGPGVIVGRKGTVGSIYWEPEDFYPIDTVFYVKPLKGLSLEYCYYMLQTLGLEGMNTDAAVPGLNRNNAYRLEIPFEPTGSLHELFYASVSILRQNICQNNEQSNVLTDLRDTLLPKLLSGELDLSEIEIPEVGNG